MVCCFSIWQFVTSVDSTELSSMEQAASVTTDTHWLILAFYLVDLKHLCLLPVWSQNVSLLLFYNSQLDLGFFH